jgi:hypothetical protein
MWGLEAKMRKISEKITKDPKFRKTAFRSLLGTEMIVRNSIAPAGTALYNTALGLLTHFNLVILLIAQEQSRKPSKPSKKGEHIGLYEILELMYKKRKFLKKFTLDLMSDKNLATDFATQASTINSPGDPIIIVMPKSNKEN